MASTAAQDEFNNLFPNSGSSHRAHPEDEAAGFSDRSDNEAGDEPTAQSSYERDEDASETANMKSTYFIPKLRSEANTGPKGVIADAQAFEQAKKQHRFSFARKSRKSSSPSGIPSDAAALPHAYRNEDYEKSSGEEDEDGFMARWRQRRLQELTDKRFGRNVSPGSRRIWGTLQKVDAEGYLDAIEQVGKNTVVVVFIYDHAVSRSTVCVTCYMDYSPDFEMNSRKLASWWKTASASLPGYTTPPVSSNYTM
jgi:hypothetical protein